MFDIEGEAHGRRSGAGDPGRSSGERRRWLAEILEFAYAGVYPLIPIALALHLAYSPAPDADRFWTVVLVTDLRLLRDAAVHSDPPAARARNLASLVVAAAPD